MKKCDTLLMFSGGLDSTGAFWQLCQDGVKLHVHHMHLKNVEGRTAAEAVAVAKIVAYMQPRFQFDYSESTHEYPSFRNRFLWDADIASFMAGNIAHFMPSIKKVAFGFTGSDGGTVQRRIDRANGVFQALCKGVEKTYPVRHLTKRAIYDMLPEDLRSLSWSCRRPVYINGEPTICGKCRTCKEIAKWR